MNDPEKFREYAHLFVDWIADYLTHIEDLPVKSKVQPGEIIRQIPASPPNEPEGMDQIFLDFQKVIIPGMTHWQSPKFFAYFPANSSFPSVLAEMLTAALGAQCMVWETSPAAAELEEAVVNWLKRMTGIPEYFHGVIQDTASTATLAALLTARERFTQFAVNERGFGEGKYRIYCSTETHSSIEKGVKIAGFGRKNLVKVRVDDQYRMDPIALEAAIRQDMASGMNPLCIVATLGTTGSTAIDPLDRIGDIARKFGTWLHVDAAFAGSALLLEEYKWMIAGIDKVDSLVFNPHKWMFTNFDCSAYFVKDKELLIKTFTINPEYLRTKSAGRVNDYRDWGIPLGRRFRALKLWFVIRSYGISGLSEKIRNQISLAQKLETWIREDENFEMVAPRTLNLVCFRFKPAGGAMDTDSLNHLNEKLMHTLNGTGKLYLSHTKLNGIFTLRMVTAQTRVEERHVQDAWRLIKETALRIN
jgi:aromatic-L-amino-acid decarboxylase